MSQTNRVASGKSVEASGRTVDQAIEAALARLGRAREDVEVKILREGSRGVLGFGAQDAIIRVTELVESVEPPAVEVPPRPQPAPVPEAVVPPQVPVGAPTHDEDDEEDEASGGRSRAAVSDDELLEISRATLLELLQHMGILADVLADWAEPEDEKEERALVLDIIGDDLGLLIGRHGESLRDIQYILRLLVGKQIEGWANIVVDVEGYKQRRERTLRSLAIRTAERVAATGRPTHLEPMSPYERRIIHLALRDLAGVETRSTGEGDNRKVGIFPTD